KLGFREASRSWTSVCADVRTHIAGGQFAHVLIRDSAKMGGNIAKAGNIVARYFNEAFTPDQCAGLQLAVWEAIEDGGKAPDFNAGHFAARAAPAVLAYAEAYYDAAQIPAPAAAIDAAAAGAQSQLAPVD